MYNTYIRNITDKPAWAIHRERKVGKLGSPVIDLRIMNNPFKVYARVSAIHGYDTIGAQ